MLGTFFILCIVVCACCYETTLASALLSTLVENTEIYRDNPTANAALPLNLPI